MALGSIAKSAAWAFGLGPPDPPPPTLSAVEVLEQRTAAVAGSSERPGTAVSQDDGQVEKQNAAVPVETAVSNIEAAQAVWGKKGRWLVIIGLCLVMVTYELDNSTVYIYKNYAVSDFHSLSNLATLSTAGTLIFAVVKPPIAKVSNVLGRGETYLVTISFYILSYILMATARNFSSYAAGTVFYSIGQSGTNLMNDIVIADITTARWRVFAIGLSFWPFLIMPWISAFIIESVTASAGGIGWRWGIGMLSIIMPFSASFIVVTLLYYQRKSRSLLSSSPSPYPSPSSSNPSQKRRKRFFSSSFLTSLSQLDPLGTLLLTSGLILLLLPLTLSSSTSSSSGSFLTPTTLSLIILGCVILFVFLPIYSLSPLSRKCTSHPILPPRYFTVFSFSPTSSSPSSSSSQNRDGDDDDVRGKVAIGRTITLSLLLTSLDNLSLGVTHTYLYAWSLASHPDSLDAKTATFLTYTNGVTQCLSAILAGLFIAFPLPFSSWNKGRGRYKSLLVLGATIRLLGYGLMLRLRGAENSLTELFLVQVVQGIGSGFVQGVVLVPAQVVVGRGEMPGVTALVICFGMIGGSVGSCVSGGIYRGTILRELRRFIGDGVGEEVLRGLAETLSSGVAVGGGQEGEAIRRGVGLAFSQVLKYMTYAAVGSSALGWIAALLFPDYELPDRNNLVEE